MIPIKEIKENIKCPQFGDANYGKWGALKIEQKIAYKQLIEANESADAVIKKQNKEIEKLKNKLSKINELINRTPRQTPTEVAYIWLKSDIAKIIGDD